MCCELRDVARVGAIDIGVCVRSERFGWLFCLLCGYGRNRAKLLGGCMIDQELQLAFPLGVLNETVLFLNRSSETVGTIQRPPRLRDEGRLRIKYLGARDHLTCWGYKLTY